MKIHFLANVLLFLFVLAAARTTSCLADDWPMYRKDAARSGITGESLQFPLRRAWTYVSPQTPQPAWPPQPKMLNRVDYDYASQLAVSGGIVCFGSSADDTVRALDLKTGQERWHFIAGGPIRFAPQIHQGKVYFAADDGVLYCLDAPTGRKVWTFRAAPWNDRMVGNKRVISRWPCRTGCLASDNVVYVTAGIWPSDGIYVYALDAKSGKVFWKNDTSSFLGGTFQDSATGNHQGEFGFTALCPEGPLLVASNTLVIPQGHMNPVRLNRHTGKVQGRQGQREYGEQYAKSMVERVVKAGSPPPSPEKFERLVQSLAARSVGYPGSGGSWITIDQNKVHVTAMHRSRTIYLNAWDADTGVGGGLRRSDKSIPQIGKTGLFRTLLPGRISFVVDQGRIHARNAFDLVITGNALLQGHENAVSATDLESQEEIWRASVQGEARGLAVAEGHLLVSTRSGEITCFASAGGAKSTINSGDPIERSAVGLPTVESLPVLEQLRKQGMDRGFCLVLGDDDGKYTLALAKNTDLHVICVLSDTARVKHLRERLLGEDNLYGTKLHVQSLPDPGKLPFAQYFANAVVLAGSPGDVPVKELYRVLRPCGGVMLVAESAPEHARDLIKQTGAPAEELHLNGPLRYLVRGPIPTANDFDNRVADPLVRWPLQPLWYGGPNPMDLADDRSGEEFAKSPAVAYGRYYIQGESTLKAVDAYNGTVLWSRPLPKLWTVTHHVDGQLRSIENVGVLQTVTAPVTETQETVPEETHDPVLRMSAPESQLTKKWRVTAARRVTANRDHVFLTLGPGYFRSQGSGVIQLDAKTGQQVAMFAPYIPAAKLSLAKPNSWLFAMPSKSEDPKAERVPGSILAVETGANLEKKLATDGGALTLSTDSDGLLLTMLTRDTKRTKFDTWDLYFDLRELAERYGLCNQETLAIRVFPSVDTATVARWEILGQSTLEPAFELSHKALSSELQETTLRLPYSAIKKYLGRRPSSFGFAATFNSHDGSEDPKIPIRQLHLFGNARAEGINAGWANVWIGEVPKKQKPSQAHVVAGPYADRPDTWKVASALPAPGIDEDIRKQMRIHPLTGDIGPKVYRSGTWACGGPSFSSTCVFRRATRPGLGIYDFADDSGLRFLGGISAPCGSNSIAACGLLLFSDSRFRCDCNPPLKTSLALAPSERVYQEDWAVFYDREVDTRVRRATLNLGAFGDRRDADGAMWLAVPRQVDRAYGYPLEPASRRRVIQKLDGVYLRHVPAGLLVPIEFDFLDTLGPYRKNSDKTAIAATDRPWLYTSGILGIRRATMKIDFLKPLMTPRVTDPIKPDGVLNESAWQTPAQAKLPHTKGEIFLRRDSTHLYMAARRPARIDRRGVTSWTSETKGQDAEVWKDDSWEFFLSDAKSKAVVHLGVAASGARFDALGTAETEDDDWNANWKSGAVANDKSFSVELAIPLSALTVAGLDSSQLQINAMTNQSDTRADNSKYLGAEGRNWNLKSPTSESLAYLGARGRAGCENFLPLSENKNAPIAERSYTVRLHFAELEAAQPGERVFDVEMQGREVLKQLDVVREAGGPRRALVKEFHHIAIGERLDLEFSAHNSERVDTKTAPILSALELFESPTKEKAQ